MRDKDYLMDELYDEDEEWPEWYDGKHINEALFCQYFLQLHPMKCIHGRLFTVDGMVEDEGEISQMILDEIQGSVTKGLAKTVSGLLAAIKIMAHSNPLPVETDRIHMANGIYHLDGTFTEERPTATTASR